MITLTKNGNAIVFTFSDNAHYLFDGTIEVPMNSLTLITDNSQMATFKKSASNDIFISATYAELGMGKSELESWFKENACGSTGGGASGITSGEVQSMIDASISGKANTSAVTAVDDALTAHTADTTVHVTSADKTAWNAKSDFSGSYNDLTDKPTIPTVPTSNTAFTNDAGYITSGEAATQIEAATSGKADTTAVTEAITAAVSGKADTSSVYTKSEVDTALSGKQDTLIAGSGITISGNVISSDGGGGKAIVAGTNISVTTGETADTVNCTLPFIIKRNGIAYNNSYGNIIIGNNNFDGANSIFTRGSNTGSNINYDIIIAGGGNKFTGAAQQMLIAGSSNEIKNTSEGYSSAGGNGIIVGQGNKINYSRHNYVFGDYNTGGTSGTTQQEYNNYLLVFGEKNKTNNTCESTFGRFNNSVSGSSTFGDSGNTLFSVGNGTSNSARHNAFEIRQNGDIYITKDGQDVKLQDQLGGGSITIDPTLDSGSTNAVANSAITSQFNSIDARISEDEEVTAAALNALNDGKQDTLIAGSGITISGNVISAEGGNLVIELTQAEYDALVDKDPNAFYIITDATEINISDYYTSAQTQSAINAAVSGKQDTLIAGSGITISGNVISANGGGSITVDTALDSGSTNPVENRVIYDKFDEVEQVTAAALNALNDKFDGLRLKKLTQAEYEALTVKDNNTLYILVG